MAEDIHTRKTTKQAQDPVCKMIVDVDKFEKNPKKYH